MDTQQQILGQLLVVVGVAITVLGVAIAAVQALVSVLKSKDQGLNEPATEVPNIGEIILELIKKGGGLAIAGVGLVLLLVGLQVMNHGVKSDVNDDLKDTIERAAAGSG